MSLKMQFTKVADKPDTPVGPHGETSLHLAAQNGDRDMAQEILAGGATVHVTDQHNNTPVIYAALRGDAEMLILLLQHDASGIRHSGNAGTALHAAVESGKMDAVNVVLEFGADIDALNGGDATPLHIAVMWQNLAMAEYLLSRGANANEGGASGETPLHFAATQGNIEMLKLLCAHGAAPGLQLQTKQKKFTALECAIDAGHEDAAHYLVLQGALPNLVDAAGKTALHLSVEKGSPGLARMLVEEGHADLNKREEGCVDAPLQSALYGGAITTVRELVRLGADTAIKDKSGRTPLHIAAWVGSLDLVRYFMEEVLPSENAPDTFSGALYDAVFYEHVKVAQYLLASGKADPNRPTASGETVLNTAILQSEPAVVAALLEAGADPVRPDKKGRTPLLLAVGRKNLPLAKLLVTHGADVNAICTEGGTSLFDAVANDDREMVEFLLASGANPMARNKEDLTPCQFAQVEHLESLVAVLKKAENDYVIKKTPQKKQTLSP
ncbi:MAG: ankyrin repeat domain-containing protein [Alphaproteobacteria bacterium]